MLVHSLVQCRNSITGVQVTEELIMTDQRLNLTRHYQFFKRVNTGYRLYRNCRPFFATAPAGTWCAGTTGRGFASYSEFFSGWNIIRPIVIFKDLFWLAEEEAGGSSWDNFIFDPGMLSGQDSYERFQSRGCYDRLWVLLIQTNV